MKKLTEYKPTLFLQQLWSKQLTVLLSDWKHKRNMSPNFRNIYHEKGRTLSDPWFVARGWTDRHTNKYVPGLAANKLKNRIIWKWIYINNDTCDCHEKFRTKINFICEPSSGTQILVEEINYKYVNIFLAYFLVK